MAKVVGKKAAAPARKPAKKQPARPASKTAATKKPAAKAAVKRKASAKPAPKAKAAPKKPVKPPKPASRPAAKAKSAPAKPAPKPATGKTAAKPAHAAHPHPAKPVAAKPAAAPAPAKPAPPVAKAAETEKKRTRRPRPKVTSSGPPTAAWFSKGENKPRPSSFIPAPPRAEAPSLVAAPPASSDRLVSAHELTEFVVRTVPVRIDVEAGGGRIYLGINPNDVALKVGEGIEWDFRYIGGADVIIDELSIEFEKPAPFPTAAFRSRRPGAARPHRQLSGPAQKGAAGKQVRYVIRAFNGFKTELATARPSVTIVG